MSALAVLWDLDGTLADSEPTHGAALVAAMAGFGIEARKDDELLGISRLGVHEHMRAKYAGIPDFDAYSAAIDSHFLAAAPAICAFDASHAAVARFAAEGRRQRIVSNSMPHIVEAIIAAIGVDGLIEGWEGNDGSFAPKPDPEPYRRGLAALGVAASEAIAVEDTVTGVSAARAAGLFVVGVGEDHAKLGADIAYPAFPDLTPEQLVEAAGK